MNASLYPIVHALLTNHLQKALISQFLRSDTNVRKLPQRNKHGDQREKATSIASLIMNGLELMYLS